MNGYAGFRVALLGSAALLSACAAEPPPPQPPPAPISMPQPVAPQDPACEAGPRWQLPAGQDVRVRFVTVSRLPDGAANALAVHACIDSIYPVLGGSIAAGVFSPQGRLAVSVGQDTAARPSGSTYTYSFGSERRREPATEGPFADTVLLQMPFGRPGADGKPVHVTTVSVAARARFDGLKAGPVHRPARDACLGPVGADASSRDVRVALLPPNAGAAAGTIEMVGCAVGRRITYAELRSRPLQGVLGPYAGMKEVVGPGNGIGLLQPVRGLVGARSIALMAGQWDAVPPVYPLVPVEVTLRSCREPAGGTCIEEGGTVARGIPLAR